MAAALEAAVFPAPGDGGFAAVAGAFLATALAATFAFFFGTGAAGIESADFFAVFFVAMIGGRLDYEGSSTLGANDGDNHIFP